MKAKGIVTILLLGILVLAFTACGGKEEEATLGKIAFVSERDGNSEIYVMNADGTGLKRLTNNPSRNNDSPVWSPDGKRIAYVSRTEKTCDIFIMYADGTDKVNLTHGEEYEFVDWPAWSPDGRLAFVAEGGIRIFAFDDRPTLRLALPLQNITLLTWSPDGDRMAFVAQEMGTPGGVGEGFYVVDVNIACTGLIRLIDDPSGGANYPAWSPDGRKIAITSKKEGNPEIYVVNADGTGLRRLTDDPLYDISPAWSPDGDRIVFARFKPMDCATFSEIFLMNADGSNQAPLTENLGWCSGYPQWSPDGEKVAFIGRDPSRDMQRDISVIRADGSGLANITNDPAQDFAPAWSP